MSEPQVEGLAALMELEAFHRGVDAAKQAIRDESVGDQGDAFFYRAMFINAIARRCGRDPGDSTKAKVKKLEATARQMMKALRNARDIKPDEWDALITPDICSAWTETAALIESPHQHNYNAQSGACFCGDIWDESKPSGIESPTETK